MQDRRNPERLADGSQPWTGQFCPLGQHQANLGAGNGVATGAEHQDVALHQFLDQIGVRVIVLSFRIVASHHGGNTADLIFCDGVDKRRQGSAERLDDGFDAEAYHAIGFDVGNMDLPRLAEAVVLHRRAHDLFGDLVSVLLVKLDVRSPGELGLGRGGDELGVETTGYGDQRGENALHVHHNGFHGAGGNGQFLLDVVADRWNPLPHQNFIAGAADAGNIDVLGAEFLRQADHLGIAAGGHDQLRQGRFMAMHNDVDLVGLEHAQVHGRALGGGGSEHHVGKFRGDHRAAPAIGKRGAQPLQHQIHRIVVDSDVGAMHGLDNFTVDAAGHDFQGVPELLAFEWCAFGEIERSLLLAEQPQ